MLLGIAAPLTLEELLKEGNARGLNRLIASAKASPKAKAGDEIRSSIEKLGDLKFKLA